MAKREKSSLLMSSTAIVRQKEDMYVHMYKRNTTLYSGVFFGSEKVSESALHSLSRHDHAELALEIASPTVEVHWMNQSSRSIRNHVLVLGHLAPVPVF